MKKTASLLRRLIKLADGETLPSSLLRGDWFDEMVDEGVIAVITHGSHRTYRATPGFRRFVANRYQIPDLELALQILEDEERDRSLQVLATGDSKFKQQRTMQGFIASTLEPIEASINGKPVTIAPCEGTFVYIYDYASFRIPADVLVVGIENAENFRHIGRQRHLFPARRMLFVSRYPLSGDFQRWIAMVDNEYLHFGDIDLAGIHIFLSEIYSRIGNRGSFLVPDDIAERLPHGSTQRYDAQLPQYGKMVVTDHRLDALVELIHHYRRGYDQEGYIQ